MRFADGNRKLEKFARLDGADKLLFIRAILALARARCMIAIFSFPRLSHRLNVETAEGGKGIEAGYLQRVSRAVTAAANNVPWRSDCFPQTIAAQMLLKRRGIRSTVHFGVERAGDDVLNGHAWLTAGDVVVTGGENLSRYTEVHSLGE